MLYIIGIYAIFNKISKKYYIGQSKDILNRFIRHKCELNANRHANSHLQKSWNKYGKDAFDFFIVEECSEDLLNARETYWITFYDSVKNGYNCNTGGDGIPGYKHTQEEIAKMRRIQSPLVVLQFDSQHNFIARYEGGVSHASKTNNYTKECIKRCCLHSGQKNSYKNCFWVYEDEYLNDRFSWSSYEAGTLVSLVSTKKKKLTVHKICQYDLQRNLVKIWDCFSDLEKCGFNRTQINSICNKRLNKKTHKGFIWAFEGYDFSDGYFDSIEEKTNIATQNRMKKILKYGMYGKFICEYSSIQEACLKNSISYTCLRSKIQKKIPFNNELFCLYTDDWIVSKKEFAYLESKNHTAPQAISKIGMDGSIIQTFPSIASAAKSIKCPVGSLHRAFKSGKQYRGFYWKSTK